ncbi:MAG: hypothetical protein JWN96_862 [Mycobacterium sp.]|nr:hypothetical protein [Mycobacterium sp.]
MTAGGAGPYGVPEFGTPPGPSVRSRLHWNAPTSRDVLSSIVVAITLIIAGVPLGLLWGWTTPKLNVNEALGGKTGILSEATFNTQAGIDVHFAFLALIFGVVAGAIVGWRGRSASWPLPIGLAVGGAAGSLVAAQIGHLMESNEVLKQIPASIRGTQLSRLMDFTLRSHGFHAVFPVAALLTFLLIVLISTRNEPPQLPAEPEPGRYWSVPR